MEEIKELINIGLSPRMDRIETFHPYQENHKTLSFQFYEGIKNNSFSTEEEARKALYGDKPEGFKFNMLKKRLKERLYNTILFMKPLNDPYTYVENVYYCHKYFSVAKLLIFINANTSGYNLLRKVLQKAQEIELHEITLFCALAYRARALQQGSESEFNLYQKLYRQTLELAQAEADAEELYHSLLMHFTRKISFSVKQRESAQENMQKIGELKNKYNTYQLTYQHFYISLVANQLSGNYEKAMHCCDEFEAYLSPNSRFKSRVRYANFLLLKLDAALYLRNYEKGRNCFEKALPLFDPGHPNWLTLHEVYFVLLLNNGVVDEALGILAKVTADKTFKTISPEKQELWSIYSGYLWVLVSAGENKNKSGEQPGLFTGQLSQHMRSFLDAHPSATADKLGYNISVLILQFLSLLLRGDTEACAYRAERLKYYLQKHLKQDETFRSQVFIRMIIRAAELNFDSRLKSDTRLMTLRRKLDMQPVNFTPSQQRIELIPYEQLWQMILGIIQENRKNNKMAG